MALTRPKYSNIVDTDYKASVRVITTTNITLSGSAPNTYDGLTLAAGDRILVNAQSTGSQNGIYIVSILGSGSNGTWIRSVDSSASAYVTAGMRTYVAEGTYAGTEFRLVTPDPITLDTTSLSFASTAATVSGTSKSVQYNNAGFVAGATYLIYDSATGNVTASSSTPSVSSTTGALVVTGGVGVGGNINVNGTMGVTGVATFNSNVIIAGNLTTLGNTYISNSTDLVIQDSIINLHSPADLAAWVTNDGKDIGLKFHYYDTSDKHAFIGRSNDTGYLEWYADGNETTGNVFSGTYGTIKTGNILLTGNTYRGTNTIGTAIQTHAIAYTTQSATPPSSPQVGDQWYDTSTDTLYEWVSDGTSSYWVDKLSQPVAISFASQATAPIGSKQGDQWYDTSSDILYTRVYDGTTYYWVDYGTQASSIAGIGALVSNISIGNLTPYGNLSYNIGNTSAYWANIYVGNIFTSNSVRIGSALTYTPTNAPVQVGYNINSYSQFTIQNASNGDNASTDIAVIANNGSDLDTYVDMGIVSSNYSQAAYSIYKPNDGYVIVAGNTVTNGGNLVLATTTAKDIVFATGGQNANNEVMRVSSANVVTVTGNLNVIKSGLFQGSYDENSATSGVFIGNTGTGTPSPRIGFYTGDTSKNWQIDNYGGQFRWFVPGATKMTLDPGGDLGVSPGNLSVAGNATVSGNAGIIQPNRTAFRVYGNGGTVGLNGNLTSTVFTVDYQQGYASTALNTSTGKFTAPIAGLYNTTLTARTTSNTNSGIIQAAIYIKSGASSAVAAFIEWGPNTSFNHASTATTVKLSVGDQMWVQCLATGGATGFSFDGNDHWDVVYLG